MAKPAKKNNAAENLENDEMSTEEQDFVKGAHKWVKRPEWSMTIDNKNRMAIINNVSDEDFELLQKDDNKGFAKDVVAWVASQSPTLKISRYQIQGQLFNIGGRGPGPISEKNPFKMRPAKKSRGTSEKASGGKGRDISTEDVVQFILSGKLDAAVFKAALDEVRQSRLAQIQKLQAELAGFDSWEKLAAAGATIGGE